MSIAVVKPKFFNLAIVDFASSLIVSSITIEPAYLPSIPMNISVPALIGKSSGKAILNRCIKRLLPQ